MVAVRRYGAEAAGPGWDVVVGELGEQPAIPRVAPGNRIKDRMAQFRLYTRV